jgi:chemotaxis protein MotB
MGKRIGLAATAAALLLLAAGCTVMESTYVRKVQEAEGLAGEVAALKKKHRELVVENDLLKSRVENQRLELGNTIMERDRIKGDLAYVTGARDKAAADNKELEALLQAKSDTLSQSIGDLRRKVVELEAENGRLRQESAALRTLQEEKARQLGQAEGEREKIRQDLAAQKKADEERARQLAELRGANEKLRSDLAAQTKAQQEKVEKVSATYEGLLQKMKGEIAKGEVTISELKGKLTLNMVDSILFDSGKSEVKTEGAAVLQKVVSILKDVRDRSIRIEGHTDNVQIGGALARQYPTNWELSAARAINVTRTLEKQGIDAASLAAVAYGETRPIAGNDTQEGRAKNRRIEIVLVAKD